jgi:hypothetical protein
MKSLIRTLLILLLTTSFITSCKKAAPKQARHIPKNAVFVATLNTKSLKAKLAKNQATLENILRSIAGNDTSITKGKQEWEDLQASGVDLDDNFYIAVVQKGAAMSTNTGTMVTTTIGTLNDAKKLEAYIKKKQPNSEIRKEKNYSYTTVSGDNMVAWAEDLVIMMSYQNSLNRKMEYDSTNQSYHFKDPVNSTNDMKTAMDGYFNLKEDESVVSIPEFRDLMQEKSDGSFWVNSSSGMANIPMPLPKLNELFANSFTAATVNFEDGQVAVNSKSYYSDELRDIIKKYTGPTADLSAIENYPSNNINGFVAFAFNPQMINALVQHLEMGGMADSYLTKMMGSEYTLTDALKAIKGDFTMVVSDFQSTAVTGGPGQQAGSSANFKMIVNIPVGDKVQMNRVMDKMVQNRMMVKTAQGYTVAPELNRVGFAVSVDDQNILIARDATFLEQYKMKTQKARLTGDVMDNFKDKSAISYVNIESIINGVPSQNTQADSVILKAKSTFKDAKGYLDNFNGKYMEGHYELRFKDEKANSLTSLLGFFETASKNIKRNGSFNRTENDSIPTLPAM